MNVVKTHEIVWTVFVRLTHWLVATSVVINFFNETGLWHRVIGYFCLALVLMRIGYGLWLSQMRSSKFYIPTITNIKMHLREIVAGFISSHLGHNPLGQLAVYLLWLLIFMLAFTGWLSRTDILWGEDWPVAIHVILSNTLQVMILLHLLAVIVMSKLQRKNLAKAMIYGK